MASKTIISFLRSLHQKKFRLEHGLFLVEGPKMVNELLHSEFEVGQIYATNDWEIPSGLKDVKVEIITNKELDQVSAMQTPHKVLATVKIPVTHAQLPLPKQGLHLLVDHIQDPGNLGTIIRIADWFGCSSICCSPDTVDLFNPKVVQATMGSIFRVGVYYGSLPDLLINNAAAGKLPVYATLLEGESVYSQEITNDGFIILGNESKGMNPLLMPFVSAAIRIPSASPSKNKAESLNVAIATGIICAEFRRQFPLK
ncbi:RNA methyltransferase [soil metagenome]